MSEAELIALFRGYSQGGVDDAPGGTATQESTAISGAEPHSGLDFEDDGDDSEEVSTEEQTAETDEEAAEQETEQEADEDTEESQPDTAPADTEQQLRARIAELERENATFKQPKQEQPQGGPKSAYDADEELAKLPKEQRTVNNKLVLAALQEMGILGQLQQVTVKAVEHDAETDKARFVAEVGKKSYEEALPFMREIANERDEAGRPKYNFRTHQQLYEIALGRKAIRERQQLAKDTAKGAKAKEELRGKADLNSNTRPTLDDAIRIPSKELKSMSMEAARSRIAASLDMEDD